MDRLIILDTETTGLGREDKIIQLAYCYHDLDDTQFIQTMSDPQCVIKPEAMATHHITPEMLTGAQPLEDTQEFQMLRELMTSDYYLVAHNAQFDIQQLKKYNLNMGNYKLIDTLKVMRALLPINRHDLQYVRYYLKLYEKEAEFRAKHKIDNITAHDAMGDVIVCYMIIDRLLNSTKRSYTLEELHQITVAPVTDVIMKFGKHKGSKISEILKSDRGYLEWIIKGMDNLDPETKEATIYQLAR